MTPLGGLVLGALAAAALVYAWADPRICELQARLRSALALHRTHAESIGRLAEKLGAVTAERDRARNAALALYDELDAVRAERNQLLADAMARHPAGRSTPPAGRRRLHAVSGDPTIETETSP